MLREILLFLVFTQCICEALEFYVSPEGVATQTCGTVDEPCSLEYGLKEKVDVKVGSDFQVVLLQGIYNLTEIPNNFVFGNGVASVSLVAEKPRHVTFLALPSNSSIFTYEGESLSFNGSKFANLQHPILSGSDSDRVIYLSTLLINGSTFSKSVSPPFDFQSSSPNFNMTVKNCEFTENSFGLIHIEAKYDISLTLIDSTFAANNQSIEVLEAGGITVKQHAADIMKIDVRVVVRGCRFEKNVGEMMYVDITVGTFYMNIENNMGAAFYVVNSNGDVSLSLNNCEFSGNFASKMGGAIAVAANQVELQIWDSVFTGNTAFEGGAVHLFSHYKLDMYVASSKFSENNGQIGATFQIYSIYADIVVEKNVVFSENVGLWGGAIFANSQNLNLEITDSRFNLNEALDSGGGIFIRSSGLLNSTIKRTNFSGNTAHEDGGALFFYIIHYYDVPIEQNSLQLVVEGCLFVGNNVSQQKEVADGSAIAINFEEEEETVSFFTTAKSWLMMTHEEFYCVNLDPLEMNNVHVRNSKFLQNGGNVVVNINLGFSRLSFTGNLFEGNYGGVFHILNSLEVFFEMNTWRNNKNSNLFEKVYLWKMAQDLITENDIDDENKEQKGIYFEVHSYDYAVIDSVTALDNDIPRIFVIYVKRNLTINNLYIVCGDDEESEISVHAGFDVPGPKIQPNITLTNSYIDNVDLKFESFEDVYLMRNLMFDNITVLRSKVLMNDRHLNIVWKNVTCSIGDDDGDGNMFKEFNSFYGFGVIVKNLGVLDTSIGGGGFYVHFRGDVASSFVLEDSLIESNSAQQGGAFEFHGDNRQSFVHLKEDVLIHNNTAQVGSAFFFNDLANYSNFLIESRILSNKYEKRGVVYYYVRNRSLIENVTSAKSFTNRIYHPVFQSKVSDANWAVGPSTFHPNSRKVRCQFYEHNILMYSCNIPVTLVNPFGRPIDYLPFYWKFKMLQRNGTKCTFEGADTDNTFVKCQLTFDSKHNVPDDGEIIQILLVGFDAGDILQSHFVELSYKFCSFPRFGVCLDKIVYPFIAFSGVWGVITIIFGIILIFLSCTCFCTVAQFLEDYTYTVFVPKIKKRRREATWNEKITTTFLKVIFFFNFLNYFKFVQERNEKEWDHNQSKERSLFLISHDSKQKLINSCEESSNLEHQEERSSYFDANLLKPKPERHSSSEVHSINNMNKE